MVGNGATARERGGEERGMAAEPTADLQGCSLWPGTRWRRRIGVGGRRRPRRKMMATAALRGVRRFVARRGGGGGCGGARKHVREARGGRWPWQRRAMATAALGCARGRENQGGGRARGRGKGPGRLRGDVPDVQASRGRTGRQVPWRHDGAHAPATRPWPPGARRGTTGASQSAGPASWAAQGWEAQVSPSVFISVFLIFLTFVLI